MTITVVGLGPGRAGDLTLEASEVLDTAAVIWLRTRVHPTVASLPAGVELHDFDHYYEQCSDFAEVYERICADLDRLGSEGDVVYAVPGHPLVGEATVRRLLKNSAAGGPAVRVVPGLSFIEPVATAAGVDPLQAGLLIVDALDPVVDPAYPTICAQVYSRRIASLLKIALLDAFPPDHEVTLVGYGGENWHGPLSELDRNERFDHLTSLYVPPLPLERNLRSFGGVRAIVHRLRSPGGCPWDREQTHASLRPFLLEETYEALEKLDAGDTTGLSEELGDLLLQLALHCEIAAEAGEFDYPDVFQGISAKLLRRHPHVFGDVAVADADEVKVNWQRIKQAERAGEEEAARSILAGVASTMPSLAYSQAVQERAAQVGFDWPDMGGVFDKLAEELQELREASGEAAKEEEFGDILFVIANVARWMKIDAEAALRGANLKFRRRFGVVERLSRERGIDLAAAGLEMLDRFWDEAKALEPHRDDG